MTKLPDGMELDLHFYLVDDAGLEAKLSLRGLPVFPSSLETNAEEVAKALGVADFPALGKWRAMTRAEISEFKKQDNDDQAG